MELFSANANKAENNDKEIREKLNHFITQLLALARHLILTIHVVALMSYLCLCGGGSIYKSNCLTNKGSHIFKGFFIGIIEN